MKDKLRAVFVPIASVVIGIIVGALIMLLFRYDAVKGYEALFNGAFGKPFNIGQTLRAATPLMLTGLGFAVAYTAGFFNIGLAGQALCGWLVSVWVGLTLGDLPSFIVLPIAIVAGMVAGALWAAIAGFLKAYFDTSEVIVTIMLNYTAIYLSDYLLRNVITSRLDATPILKDNATLKMQWLSDLTNGSTLHAGIFIAVLMILVVHILMTRTTLGFELKAVGMNKFASAYAGMNAKRNIILSMVLSGALAGLGGVMNGLGEFRNIFLMNGKAPDIGFDGMAVALLGMNNPIGIFFSSILFGGLKTGGNLMPLAAKIPSEIVNVVIGCIIFFVGCSYIFRFIMEKVRSNKVSSKEGA